VDLIVIAGFSSGVFVFTSEAPGDISKPIVEKLSFVILLYCNAVILVWISSIYERKIKSAGIKKREQSREAFVGVILAYALWTPSFLVWGDWYFSETSVFWTIVGIVVGGIGLIFVSAAFSEIIHPYSDEGAYKSTNN